MKSKILSLITIFCIYALAFGAAAAFLLFFPRPLHPLAALFFADVIATMVVFIFNVILKNASIYDPYWSVQPIFIIFAMYGRFELTFQLFHLIALIPLAAWSVRLTINWAIGFENMYWEDWRYRDIKKRFPRLSQLIIFTGIMMMPTCLVFMGIIPLWYFFQIDKIKLVFPLMGGLVILLGTIIELIADTQMHRFKKNPNCVQPYIDYGLWRYSRHPNYLGEIFIWLGIFIIGLANFTIQNLAGILSMIFLFTVISIPLMERHLLEKYPEYSVYQKTVMPLVFGPRKKNKA